MIGDTNEWANGWQIFFAANVDLFKMQSDY